VPGKPKARERWFPDPADTAQAPKNIISARTINSTNENVSGTGTRLGVLKLL